jgi:polyhydroxyalkanoate synthesis regulator phasin
MSLLDDIRRAIEGAIGDLTPARAQQLAKDMMEPGAAKEQVAKAAADLLEWSHRNRERLAGFVRGEIREQVRSMGVATQDDLDGVKKRVRDLERAAGMTASGRAKKSTARRSPSKKATAKKVTAKPAAKATGD